MRLFDCLVMGCGKPGEWHCEECHGWVCAEHVHHTCSEPFIDYEADFE